MPSCLVRSSMLAIKGAPANHNIQTCYLGPRLYYVSISHSNYSLYIVALKDPVLFEFLAPVTDVTKYSFSKKTHKRVTKNELICSFFSSIDVTLIDELLSFLD